MPAATSRDDLRRRAALGAERRRVSVLFADLENFTGLAEALDPEEVRAIQSRYFEVARGTVAVYGGVIEKFIGDAVVAVWGAPVAHEDDAERAVRAALDLVAAVGELAGSAPRRPARRAGRGRDRRGGGRGRGGAGPRRAATSINTAARLQAAAATGDGRRRRADASTRSARGRDRLHVRPARSS